MCKGVYQLILALLLSASASAADSAPPAEPGDVIFHTSRSSQSQAIQQATHSKYSHVGLVLRRGGHLVVLEAAGTVRFTPLQEWISRGTEGKYALMRLRTPTNTLTGDQIQALERAAKPFIGKPYDLYFEWADDRIYCSELIWKIYKRGLNQELGELSKLRDFDLTSPVVKAKLRERFKETIPLNETVISPSAIADSPLLIQIQ